ncbi:hypothetical protein L917_08690, partial [Phytophthora nicotianae]
TKVIIIPYQDWRAQPSSPFSLLKFSVDDRFCISTSKASRSINITAANVDALFRSRPSSLSTKWTPHLLTLHYQQHSSNPHSRRTPLRMMPKRSIGSGNIRVNDTSGLTAHPVYVEPSTLSS